MISTLVTKQKMNCQVILWMLGKFYVLVSPSTNPYFFLSSIALTDKDELGFTYDVSNNSIAKITSDKNRNVRFDRVLSKSRFWAPSFASLFACEPVSLFSSTAFSPFLIFLDRACRGIRCLCF